MNLHRTKPAWHFILILSAMYADGACVGLITNSRVMQKKLISCDLSIHIHSSRQSICTSIEHDSFV